MPFTRQISSSTISATLSEYILGETDELKKAETFDRHYQESIVDWWKKLASKRYEKLKSEDRVRRELELWNENTNIDIIR